MFLNGYPYTDFHEMNADFVVRAVTDLAKAFKDFTASNSLIFAEPLLHDLTKTYAKNTIVLDSDGNAYIALQNVPEGVQLANADYWMIVFNFEEYTEKANKNFTVNYLRDTTRAPQAYAVGDWLVLDDVLYKVIAIIAIDDLLEVDTNIVHFTIEQFLKDFIQTVNNTLYNYSLTIQQYKNDIDASELAYRQQLAQDIANTTASLQAQLDLAISGATVDSEVINARIGADGVTYPTLGDAIRTQFGNVIADMEAEHFERGDLTANDVTIAYYGDIASITPDDNTHWCAAVTTHNIIIDTTTSGNNIVIGESISDYLAFNLSDRNLYTLSKTATTISGVGALVIRPTTSNYLRIRSYGDFVCIDSWNDGAWSNLGVVDITQYGSYTYKTGVAKYSAGTINLRYFNVSNIPSEAFRPSRKEIRATDNAHTLTNYNATGASWWTFYKTTGLLIIDNTDWTSQIAIAIDSSYIYSIANSGGALGYLFNLSRSNGTFSQVKKYDFITDARFKMLQVVDGGIAWYELINDVWIYKGLVDAPSGATPIVGYVHNTALTDSFNYGDEFTMSGLDDAFNTEYKYPYINGKMYVLGDSQSYNGWYLPHMKETLKLSEFVNFSASGNPIQQITGEDSFYSRHGQLITYATANSEVPDIILINGGTNDFGRDLPIGVESDTNPETLIGALDAIVNDYVTAFPTCTIVLVAPTQRNDTAIQYHQDGNGPNALGLYLIDYVNAIKLIGERYSCKVVDLYAYGGINLTNARENAVTFNGDGLHYSKAYSKHISDVICKHIY